MDLSYSPEEEAFRAKVRRWIEANKPQGDARPGIEELRDWQKRLHAAGYLGAAWPKQHGGGGLSDLEQAILNEEFAQANAPGALGSMGISWVGPAILRFGTEQQKQKFVPRVLSGDDIWATGYSEPNAGSDMYNTQTRAVKDGDHYIINGQKVWTSLAHASNWYFLLVRTSTDGHKVAGLSLFLVPMDTPGIDIRPTPMITGDREFSEVFLSDVRVHQSCLLGKPGQGYEIVSSALINERSGIASGIRFEQSVQKLIATARRFGLDQNPSWRERIASLAIQAKVMKAFGLRVLSDQLHGRFNPHSSAAMKCIATRLTQEFSETGVEMEGYYGTLFDVETSAMNDASSTWSGRYLSDRAMTIAGGTTEIQKNIAAERILGLPRR